MPANPEDALPPAANGTSRNLSAEKQVLIFKALADETRLRLLRLLQAEELNVQELCRILDAAQPKVSRHLAVLRQAGLVQDRREGTRVFYSLTDAGARPDPVQAYLEELGASYHPDLERLDACLRSRTQFAQSFADRKADQWDEIGRRLHSTSASLLALAHLVPRGLILADLGTGTGLMLPFLSACAERVFAIDQSREMLRRARRRCRQLGIDNVEFLHASLEEPGPRLPECHGLLLHFVLHQIARPHQLLQTLSTHLRPGGRLVIVDRQQHQDERAKQMFGSLWLGFSSGQLDKWTQ